MNTKKTFLKPEAVFFDWDNTIIQTDFISELVIERIVAKQPNLVLNANKNATVQDLINIAKKNFFLLHGAPLDEQLRCSFGEKNLDFVMKEYKRHCLDLEEVGNLRPIEHAIETLKVLYNKKIPLAVISNKFADLVRKEVEELGLTQIFFAVVGMGDCEACKPTTAQITHAFKVSGKSYDTTKCWFVGDSEFDVLCGINLGAKCFFVGQKERLSENIRIKVFEGEIHHVSNKELLKIVEEL